MNTLERIRAVLNAEAEAILAVNVTSTYEDAVNAILLCGGKVITTGIGKAGHIAHKFTATLCSPGVSILKVGFLVSCRS